MQRGSFCVFPAQLGDGRLVSNNTCVFLLDTSTHSGLRHNAERAGSPATTERARSAFLQSLIEATRETGPLKHAPDQWRSRDVVGGQGRAREETCQEVGGSICQDETRRVGGEQVVMQRFGVRQEVLAGSLRGQLDGCAAGCRARCDGSDLGQARIGVRAMTLARSGFPSPHNA